MEKNLSEWRNYEQFQTLFFQFFHNFDNGNELLRATKFSCLEINTEKYIVFQLLNNYVLEVLKL